MSSSEGPCGFHHNKILFLVRSFALPRVCNIVFSSLSSPHPFHTFFHSLELKQNVQNVMAAFKFFERFKYFNRWVSARMNHTFYIHIMCGPARHIADSSQLWTSFERESCDSAAFERLPFAYFLSDIADITLRYASNPSRPLDSVIVKQGDRACRLFALVYNIIIFHLISLILLKWSIKYNLLHLDQHSRLDHNSKAKLHLFIFSTRNLIDMISMSLLICMCILFCAIGCSLMKTRNFKWKWELICAYFSLH